MSGEFTTEYDPGFLIYALVLDPTGTTAWNGTVFIDPAGHRPDCAVAMADNEDGTYSGQIPDSVPSGNYPVAAYLQLGADPDDSDPTVGFSGLINWPGSGDATPVGAGLFEQALAARLAGDAVIAANVGPRIYNGILPQTATLPAITYKIASSANEQNLDGPNGIVRARVEIRSFALDYSTCRDIKEQVRQMFDGFRGLLSGLVTVIETVQKDDPDSYDEPTDSSDDGTHQVLSDYLFRYRVSKPAR